jgi:hypothetical protein
MGTARNTLDHGAALRVPPAHNAKDRGVLMMWLGECGRVIDGGLVEVTTPLGAALASPGDWIVLSATGAYHVARTR